MWQYDDDIADKQWSIADACQCSGCWVHALALASASVRGRDEGEHGACHSKASAPSRCIYIPPLHPRQFSQCCFLTALVFSSIPVLSLILLFRFFLLLLLLSSCYL